MLKNLTDYKDETVEQEPKKVTFADYERFLDGLDAQQKLEMLEESNPKSVKYQDQGEEDMERMDKMLEKELRKTLKLKAI